MDPKKRICATDRTIYGLCLGMGICCLGFGLWGLRSGFNKEVLMAFVAGLFAFGYGGWELIHLKYLDGEGIICCRFGKPYRVLPWTDVAQVHKIHRYNVSLRSSSRWVIVITPKGCPPYVPGSSCDSHLADCRGQAIVLDDSKKTRNYIEAAWGKVIVMGTRGNILE